MIFSLLFSAAMANRALYNAALLILSITEREPDLADWCGPAAATKPLSLLKNFSLGTSDSKKSFATTLDNITFAFWGRINDFAARPEGLAMRCSSSAVCKDKRELNPFPLIM